MKIYQCQHCGHPVYFENVVCTKCRSPLGYLGETDEMVALAPGNGPWHIVSRGGQPYQYCANHDHGVCNWMVPAKATSSFCQACALNQTIPNLDDPENVRQWRDLEAAKHRLVYALQRLHLPLLNKQDAPIRGLAFDFLADDASGQVMTGHDAGLVTINTKEADPVQREAARIKMNERYRTLIGHFRHEVGHYYWDLLVYSNTTRLTEFRDLFGDERKDYAAALQQHYWQGAPAHWAADFISEYATAHPWEDWAETWAHYLHLMDMLETAHAFGLQLSPTLGSEKLMHMSASFDPYLEPDFGLILSNCLPLTFAVNSLNRGMGRKDLYPFIVNDSVRKKLHFVHQVVRSAGITA